MGGASARFPTTSWALVLRATRPDARQSALGLLCEIYWPPVFAYLCRSVGDPEAAKDLTQGFFARLVEKRDLSGCHEQGGRFRAYLLACVKHFVSNERDRARAQKRGGGHPGLQIDLESPEVAPYLHDASVSPERAFERRWALMIIDRALHSVRRRYEAAGQLEQFERLKASLVDGDLPPHRLLASQLGLSESAVKMAVLRLRRRFAEALREEIALTVANPGEVNDEIGYLLGLLRTQP
jgi:RNA polymerase sigma-70 factor (ECF subfamily)